MSVEAWGAVELVRKGHTGQQDWVAFVLEAECGNLESGFGPIRGRVECDPPVKYQKIN